VTGHTAGTIDFSGTLTCSNLTCGSTSGAIEVTGNSGGTIQFSGGTKTLTSNGANAGVSLSSNTGATINFTNGGLALTTATGTGFTATGGGTLAVTTGTNNNTISASGGTALLLNGVTISGSNVSFSTTSSTGGTNNIALTGTLGTGSIALGSGALSGASGTAFAISGANANPVSYSGSVTKTSAGQLVSIAGHTAGTIDLSGALTCSNLTCGSTSGAIGVSGNSGGTIQFTNGTKTLTSNGTNVGVSLSSNTGSTINFTNGGLAITTATGNGFSATGGGTVAVTTGTNDNTITSVGGIALNVTSTTIGSGGLTFKSISANGGSNGIVLTSTGTSGGLTVTGTAVSATNDGSGGTIQNATGAEASPVENATLGVGVYLNNTKNVSLNHMNLHDFSNYAVAGTSVNGFTMTYSTINGTNGTGTNRYGGFGEGSVMFQGLFGSAVVDHSDFSGGAYSTFTVLNNGGQILNRATFTFCSFAQTDVTGNDALTFQGTGGTLNVTVQNSTFTAARGDLFQIDLHGTIASDLVFGGVGHGNTLSNSNTNSLGGGITLGGGGQNQIDTFTFDISNNTMQGAKASAIAIGAGTGAGTNHNYSGTINANTIGVQGTANSGSFGGSDIAFIFNDAGAANVSITNNFLYQYNNEGINLTFGAFGSSNPYVQAAVTGNTINTAGSFGSQGFLLTAGTATGDAGRYCMTLGGAGTLANSLTGSGANGSTDIRIRNRFDVKIGFPGYTGSTTNTAALGTYLQARNGGAPTVSIAAPSLGTTNGTTNGFYQTCPPP
ncbi:MAG: hypothetical protein JWM95_2804, partial [Gemmatimonadetes bacterium]|nr:hypothetical protein [Gemmatimonadota bacterium]